MVGCTYLYKQIVCTYCGEPRLSKGVSLVEKDHVLIKVFYVLFTEVDRAITKCILITSSNRRVLGSIAVGRVIDVGPEADSHLHDKLVITLPFCCNALIPIDMDGPAQEFYSISSKCVNVVPRTLLDDPLSPITRIFSIDEELLDIIRGREVLLLGDSLAIAAFYSYSIREASLVATVRLTTPTIFAPSAEQISIDSGRKFDVVVALGLDYTLCYLVRKFCGDRCYIITYPYLSKLLRLEVDRSCRINILRFNNLSLGLSLLNSLRHVIEKSVKLYYDLIPEAPIHSPSIAVLRRKRSSSLSHQNTSD